MRQGLQLLEREERRKGGHQSLQPDFAGKYLLERQLKPEAVAILFRNWLKKVFSLLHDGRSTDYLRNTASARKVGCRIYEHIPIDHQTAVMAENLI